MDAKIKKLWTTALRSGEIQQGRGKLRDKYNKMCCLGVLCNLHAQAHPEIAAREIRPTWYMGQDGYPPPEVMKWAGFAHSTVDPTVRRGSEKVTLVSLNDDFELNFHQIADIIEKQL